MRTSAYRSIIMLTALEASARFAEPDLLSNIEGLTLNDLQYVVDNVNPFERLAPGGLLGDFLFPRVVVDDLDFKYLKGSSRAAVLAHMTTHNSQAPLAPRRGATVVQGEIPAIKQKRLKDAATLIRLQNRTGDARARVIAEIFDDVTAGRLGVIARIEQLRMQAFTTGHAVHEADEELRVDVDYGVPVGHQETLAGVDLWSAATSTPLDDLQGWQDTMIADTGQRMERAYTSSRIIQYLRSHAAVRAAIWGVNQDRVVTTDQLNALLRDMGLPAFFAYDLVVNRQLADGTLQGTRLFPENRVVLTPGEAYGPVGRTFSAPTAEEATRTVAPGLIAIDGQRIATHIYTATQDPKGLVTLATASAFPSFDGADFVFQAKVLA